LPIFPGHQALRGLQAPYYQKALWWGIKGLGIYFDRKGMVARRL